APLAQRGEQLGVVVPREPHAPAVLQPGPTSAPRARAGRATPRCVTPRRATPRRKAPGRTPSRATAPRDASAGARGACPAGTCAARTVGPDAVEKSRALARVATPGVAGHGERQLEVLAGSRHPDVEQSAFLGDGRVGLRERDRHEPFTH